MGKRRFESYSQMEEDFNLAMILDSVEKGFYIDIGANDPTLLSVTKHFYDRGWRGINIEPLQDMYDALCEIRERDININAGIGKNNEKKLLSVCGTGSTFCKMDGEKIECKILTLTDIYKNYCIDIKDIHFCKIDVEGFEREVLEGIEEEAWKQFRPWIYVIESTVPGTAIPCYEKWEYLLIQHDYIFAYQDNLNRYYIDKSKKNMLQKFNNLKLIRKNYNIIHLTDTFYSNFEFPVERLKEKEKVVLYGMGKVGQLWYRKIINDKLYELVAWTGSDCIQKKEKMQNKIYDLKSVLKNIKLEDEFLKLEYDKVIIACGNEKIQEEIKEKLVRNGVDMSKVVEGFR